MLEFILIIVFSFSPGSATDVSMSTPLEYVQPSEAACFEAKKQIDEQKNYGVHVTTLCTKRVVK